MATTITKQFEGVDGYGSYSAPPEACEDDALPGEDYCMRHLEDTSGWEELLTVG